MHQRYPLCCRMLTYERRLYCTDTTGQFEYVWLQKLHANRLFKTERLAFKGVYRFTSIVKMNGYPYTDFESYNTMSELFPCLEHKNNYVTFKNTLEREQYVFLFLNIVRDHFEHSFVLAYNINETNLKQLQFLICRST